MHRSTEYLAATMLALSSAMPGLAADPSDRPGFVHFGEKLDPADYGPAVVETMEEVFARDRARSAEAAELTAGRGEQRGVWAVPSRGATEFVASGDHNVVNKWGDTCMAISFPAVVDVHGAYFAGQGGRGVWTPGVRVIGYLDGVEVKTSGWFRDIGAGATWFEMGLHGINRIVIQSQPAIERRGWYAMDDLTYAPAGAPHQAVVVDFDDCNYRQTLSGTGYAGLVWETAPDDFETGVGIHHPRVPSGLEEEPIDPTGGDASLRGGGGTLPDLLLDFRGLDRNDPGGTVPPDTCGAVGPNHFLSVVNRTIAAYDKTDGQRVWISTLGSFLPGSNGDPRVLYDQHSGRWIVIVSDFSSRTYLAVSLSSNPTGSWFKTNFVVSQGSDAGLWPDYPTLGVDADGIYSAAYMVGGGMSIFAVDKAPLVAPSPSLGTVTAFRGLSWEGAIQPVHTYGNPGGEYFVSRRDSASIRVRRLTGPLTSPTLTEMGNATVPSHSSPLDAPALGSGTPLDTVGHRLMNAVYRDGSIWTAHTIGFGAGAACRWYQIDVTGPPSLVQNGTVSDNTLYYFFPALTVSARGDVIMGFTGSHANQYAGAYYTGRLFTDPLGEMAVPFQYRAGQAAQNNLDGYGRNRWGDYSLSTLDPTDENTMWTIQEYAEATNVWGTWIASLALFNDCNGNGINDIDDIAAGTSLDCNGNGQPDECESQADCQSNGLQDICDVAAGTSLDCNGNEVPDECETDCNGSGFPDDCDISAGTSADCQPNGVPDECETDCNANNIPDQCDIAAGTSLDCQADGIPDGCQLVGNDCNVNGIPDECENDCNLNSASDDCDIAAGTSGDCNANGVPDECDVLTCQNLWGGFNAPAFVLNDGVHGRDTDGDGVLWDNPAGTVIIFPTGCQAGDVDDYAVQVNIDDTLPTPEDGYVASEHFRPVGGPGDCDAAIYTLRLAPKIEFGIDSRWDWELIVYDAVNDAAVIRLEFAATGSQTVGAGAGRILVKEPATPPGVYLDTGVPLAEATCWDVQLALDNIAGTVSVSIDGTPAVTTTPLENGAQRMDYFRLQPVDNVSVGGSTTKFSLDAFSLCLTGCSAVPPSVYDCNGNGVLDSCDITAGTSVDCNGNLVADECETLVGGDFDADGDVDLGDYAWFRDCMAGPEVSPAPFVAGCAGTCLAGFDANGDGDVDAADFAAFQETFTGAP